jgi:hypothetical protein
MGNSVFQKWFAPRRRGAKSHQRRQQPFAAPALSIPFAAAVATPGEAAQGPYRVISFATRDGRYDAELAALERNCAALHLEFSGILLPPVGREDACLFKPSFIKYELYKGQRPVLWVDADGRFLKPPVLPAADWDLCLIRNERPREHNQFAAFCVGLNYTPRCLAFLDIWEKLCELRIPDFGLDHYRMNCALAAYREHLRIADMQQANSDFFARDVANEKHRIF